MEFTHEQFAAQQRAFWDYTFSFLLKLARDAERGVFAADEQTRLEAEELLKATHSFYGDLLIA